MSYILKVGFSGDSDDPIPDLPDVKSESGFDAVVEDWGDEEDFELPV